MKTIASIGLALACLASAASAQTAPAEGRVTRETTDRVGLFLLDLADGRSVSEATQRARRDAIREARWSIRSRRIRARYGVTGPRPAAPAVTAPAGSAARQSAPSAQRVVGQAAPGVR